MSTTIAAVAPRLGLNGERLIHYAAALESVFDDTARLCNVSKAAVVTATIGIVASVAASIGRAEASDLFAAIATAIRNPAESAELDRRRVDRCAAALFEVDQRRG